MLVALTEFYWSAQLQNLLIKQIFIEHLLWLGTVLYHGNAMEMEWWDKCKFLFTNTINTVSLLTKLPNSCYPTAVRRSAILRIHPAIQSLFPFHSYSIFSHLLFGSKNPSSYPWSHFPATEKTDTIWCTSTTSLSQLKSSQAFHPHSLSPSLLPEKDASSSTVGPSTCTLDLISPSLHPNPECSLTS